MLEKARRSWRELKASPPGRRFQERHERRRRRHEGGARKAVTLGAGVVLVLVGLVLLPAPGPGMVVVALGGALLARESARVARLLDRTEVLGRRILGWARRRWQRAALPLRFAIVLVAVAVATGTGWVAWRVVAG